MTDVTCVLTRVELRSALLLPLAVWAFRRVQQSLRNAPHLIHSSLLVEGPRCLVTCSIWTEPRALEAVARSHRHVDVVRATYNRWSRTVWSTQWHLTRVSPSSRGLPEGLADALDALGGRAQPVGMLIRCGAPPNVVAHPGATHV